MDRFYVDADCKIKTYIDDKDEVKHISKVMRMKEGDLFEVFDITGAEYIGKISYIDKDRVDFEICEQVSIDRELESKITLYQGLPKQQKMEYIIQKTTELGIFKIVPCKFKRCVSELKEKEEKKIDRWQKIALEAAKQSKRSIIPKVEFSMTLKEAMSHMKENELNIVFYELEQTQNLKMLLKSFDVKPKSVGIFVGPEGGFTQEEIKDLLDNNVQCVTLGTRILRTETAGVYGVSVIAYEYE